MKLCLNPYAANWTQLRDSPIAKQFKTGLVNPVAEEAAGEAYMADTDLPQADSAAVLRYLEDRYGLGRTMYMDMKMATAVVAVRP